MLPVQRSSLEPINNPIHLERDQMARVVGDSSRRLLFRGWSRLCLHAAALNAVEGAYSAATATARAARAVAEEERATKEISKMVDAKEQTSTERRRQEDELRRTRAKITVRQPLISSS